MFVRAIGRYLGFSSEHHPAESEDTQTVDQSDPPSDRSRGGIRRALLRSTFALVLFGGPVLFGFSLAMLWGVIAGTYSTIYVAAPLEWYLSNRGKAHAKEMQAEAGSP